MVEWFEYALDDFWDTISNNIHLINAAGEDIDAGVPVLAELVTVSEDGTRDYSAFYDFDRIRECIR